MKVNGYYNIQMMLQLHDTNMDNTNEIFNLNHSHNESLNIFILVNTHQYGVSNQKTNNKKQKKKKKKKKKTISNTI